MGIWALCATRVLVSGGRNIQLIVTCNLRIVKSLHSATASSSSSSCALCAMRMLVNAASGIQRLVLTRAVSFFLRCRLVWEKALHPQQQQQLHGRLLCAFLRQSTPLTACYVAVLFFDTAGWPG
jgi:hypothetical protein